VTTALSDVVWLLHMAACLFMVGLIWVIQIVHYPLFDGVGTAEFPAYQRRHQHLMTWVVGPPMLMEVVSAVALIAVPPTQVGSATLWIGNMLLGVIWLSTIRLQVPCHAALSEGFQATVHARLVRSNWIRTAAWSARGILLVWAMWARGG
jgi:hypothetical protein